MSLSSKTLNVLDLRDSPWVDGPGRTVLECAQGLNNNQLKIIVGSFRPLRSSRHTYTEEAINRGLQTALIPENSAFDPFVLDRIYRIIKKEKIDIVHTHELRSNLLGLISARRCRIPAISTVHGWIANDIKGQVKVHIDQFLLRFFDRIITVSKCLSRSVVKSGVNPRKVNVIPNTLKLNKYQIDRNEQPLRDDLGISSEDILVSKIGRLSTEKGYSDLLTAFALATEHRHDVHLAIIGIGPEEHYLREQVASLGIERRVHFCGFRQDMINCYNSIDLVVQASYTEGMPNVILEALAMAVPVIATDVGGTNEIIKDKETGILIPPGEIETMILYLQGFLDKPNRYRTMASMGRKDIFARFDSRDRLNSIRQIYNQFSVGN